jgi:hemolysin activation/secretion protein
MSGSAVRRVVSFGRRAPVITAFVWGLAAASSASAGDVAKDPTVSSTIPVAQASGLPPLEGLPSLREQAVPNLPVIPPSPPLQLNLALPPQTRPALQSAPGEAQRFVLHDVKIVGNTVLDETAIHGVFEHYVGKPVTNADLEEMRRQFTLLYVNRGYINSGAVIPDQNVENGVVMLQFVEGHVTDIEVFGTEHFAPDYFRSRLALGATPPFNVENMQREQQILLQDPLVKRLNIELQPGLEPGEARLQAGVLEGNRYSLSAGIADDQSPTDGEVRGQLQGTVANILGYGDVLTAQYGHSQGINDGFIGYSTPIASDDTRLSLRYDRNGTLVIAPALSPLNITSSYSSVAVGLSRPFYRTAEQNLTLGLSLERRQAQTFLLGMPFSFTAGSENGNTNVTALRFSQDWLDRDAERAFAARSTFSFGIPVLDATVTHASTSANFFAWLGQGQYVHRLFGDWDVVVRSVIQLSNKPLFPIEQFALGGLGNVRGYRSYLTVTDDAFLGSGELRIPVGKLRLPKLADTDEAGTVQIVPFYDYGAGWNVGTRSPYPPNIAGVGAGLRWVVGSGIIAEFYYGKALRNVSVGNSLEDRGIYFRLTTGFF